MSDGLALIAWRPRYALAAIALFVIEAMIAVFVHDRVIRPYAGDALAVALVYCGLRAVSAFGVFTAVMLAFVIACMIEFGQWFGLVDRLGLGHSRIARVVIGTGFDPHDFAAYALGGAAILLVEAARRRGR